MSRTVENGRPYSLRRRLTIGVGFFLGLILLLLSAALWSYARAAANQTYDLLLSGAAITILERIAITPTGIEVDLAPAALDILSLAESDRVFYRILDGEGRTLTGSDDLPPPPLERDERATFYDDVYSGEPVRFVVRGRNLIGLEHPQWVGVQIGQTRLARDELQMDFFLRGMIPLAGLALASLVFVRLGIGLAMRPLLGLERDIQARKPSDLAGIKFAPPREVEGLIHAINGFMRRLDQSKDNAQTFIADVSHQLRTSLSALQSQIQLAREAPTARIAGERLTRAEEQADRTIRLTNQLLSHAMVLHRADALEHQSVDLIDVIRNLIEEVLRGNRAHSAEFGVDSEALQNRPAVIDGDPIALREALRNLVDNALRHGPENNSIQFTLAPARIGTRPALRIAVIDSGPGIPANERARVTERFYSRGHKGGSGLGLAIVAAVATSHGGRLELSEAPGGGLCATFVVPTSSMVRQGDGSP
ncbi:MAG TPA: sensor histidine kinase [Aurantimonas sp.]|uniref:histidine kinase n=1 Tax=Aurantimonas marianensis TaxID=2920428 RepID=A0A9X2H8T4_9HYPH|nr:sensor histidine kinase [Aurantimonas marianensis]MCP3055888.1 sensor histidine kinase [Aurantimonas marianensis]